MSIPIHINPTLIIPQNIVVCKSFWTQHKNFTRFFSSPASIEVCHFHILFLAPTSVFCYNISIDSRVLVTVGFYLKYYPGKDETYENYQTNISAADALTLHVAHMCACVDHIGGIYLIYTQGNGLFPRSSNI